MDGSEAPMIGFAGVTKAYPDGTVAVDQLDLDVPPGSIVTLVGPSGCGKSTTLRMVNRLVEPTAGTITVDGADVSTVDPVALRRRIGYVIQQVGLFPHQTIRANVGTVPALLGWDKARLRARCDEMLAMVGLDPATYADRYPHQLSGGQRQRVGVARALAADPPVLLMDEPFGAVDPIVRSRLQEEFRRLQKELGKTVLFVTHDIDEAVILGDQVAVLAQGGRLAQYDTPARVLGEPADEFVTEFVGADRGLRRLAVTPISSTDLEQPTGVDAQAARRSGAWVTIDASLNDALATMLRYDAGWVAVVDDGRLLGVLTPAGLHRAMRRSISVDGPSADGEQAAGAVDPVRR